MDKKEKTFSIGVFKELVKNSFYLGKIVWKEKKGSVLGMMTVFLALSFIPFLESGARGEIINKLVEGLGNKNIDPKLILATGIFVLSIFLFLIFSAVQNYMARIFFFFTGEKFELMIIKKKGELDIAAHEDPKYNNLLNKVTEQGVWRMKNFIERQFYLFQNILEVIIASTVVVFSSWWILPIILLGVLPEFITEAKYGKDVWGIHTARAETRRRYLDLHRHFNWLPSLVELKLFQNIPYFFSSIKELFQGFQLEERKNEKRKLLYRLASISFSQAAFGFAVVWFIFEVIKGNLLVGTLIFVLASMGSLRQALSGLFSNMGRQYQDNLFITDFFSFINIKPAIKKPLQRIILNPNKTPEISFNDIYFSYPGTDKMVLKNFSLTISPGEKIALVGVNGAGKTTLIKLLCRFYDPDKGNITIDGYDLKEIDLESWYSQIGAIFQEYAHYHFTVKEAIAVGRTGGKSSLEKVKDAAKAAEADIFIEEWEKNYNQMLGKEFSEGVEPSIGQWQKLALARTFYRDPRVMILDEPTSSIDAEAEAKIFEKLETLPSDRTVILISHRFSTVRQANRIAVIENGEIKELGSHEELIDLKGVYSHLFNLQAKGYK